LPHSIHPIVFQYDRRNAALKRATASAASRDWTEQETLLLLEGLELFKDDWNKVAKLVFGFAVFQQ
jgi:hypothetical protein